MQAEMPFFDSPEDAIRNAVQQLGGAKQVGPLLWPDKSVDAASRLLLDCLNQSRSEKLEISQVLHILRLARNAGFHATTQWLNNEIGYEARPVVKEEEMDRLTSVVEQSTKTLAAALKQLERIQTQGNIKAVS
jgi:hypothetical protein